MGIKKWPNMKKEQSLTKKGQYLSKVLVYGNLCQNVMALVTDVRTSQQDIYFLALLLFLFSEFPLKIWKAGILDETSNCHTN